MDRLDYLFERCLSGKATDEEHAELLDLLQTPEMEEKARGLLRLNFMNPGTPQHLPVEISRSIIEAITSANKETLPSNDTIPSAGEEWSPRPSIIRRRAPLPHRRVFVMAAAVILLVIAGTWLFIFHKTNNPDPAIRQASNQRPVPSGNKAILTLDNGDKIILDSAGNGTLATQGSTQIVKLANGQLAYRNAQGSEANPVYNIMETPRGGGYHLSLPDGSGVWLNSASSIRFPTAFTGRERRVQLTGEAYFEVAKNEKAPFIVESRGLQVQVMGTEFDLMAYNDEDAIKTTLVSGAVSVGKGDHKNILHPGQQATLSDGSETFRISPADLEEVLAWKEGKFRFTSSNIKVIMRQIARWYDVDIVYKGTLPDIEFSGVFPRKEYVSELLDVLEDAVKVHFTTEGNTITVTAAK